MRTCKTCEHWGESHTSAYVGVRYCRKILDGAYGIDKAYLEGSDARLCTRGTFSCDLYSPKPEVEHTA